MPKISDDKFEIAFELGSAALTGSHQTLSGGLFLCLKAGIFFAASHQAVS